MIFDTTVKDAAKARLPVMAYPMMNVLTTAMTLQVRDLAKDLFLVATYLPVFGISITYPTCGHIPNSNFS